MTRWRQHNFQKHGFDAIVSFLFQRRDVSIRKYRCQLLGRARQYQFSVPVELGFYCLHQFLSWLSLKHFLRFEKPYRTEFFLMCVYNSLRRGPI